MADLIGGKLRKFRDHFGMSHTQVTKLMGDVSHSAWGYWEKHGASEDRLKAVAKLTVEPDRTLEWLTSANGKMPNDITLIKPIPEPGGPKAKSKAKKKTKRGKTPRRTFTDQDRANILAELKRTVSAGGNIIGFCDSHGLGTSMMARWKKMDLPRANNAAVPGIVEKKKGPAPAPPPKAGTAPLDKAGRRVFTPQDRSNVLADWKNVERTGITFDSYCINIGVAHSVVRRWMTMQLPSPNGAAVPGVIAEQVLDFPVVDTDLPTNMPQIPMPPPGKPGPKTGTRGGYRPSKVTKAKALITSQYLCPHCGSPVFLPEE